MQMVDHMAVNSCEHCRNYKFILIQLQLLKKQISHKNNRIVELQMFIAKISEMALVQNNSTQAQDNEYYQYQETVSCTQNAGTFSNSVCSREMSINSLHQDNESRRPKSKIQSRKRVQIELNRSESQVEYNDPMELTFKKDELDESQCHENIPPFLYDNPKSSKPASRKSKESARSNQSDRRITKISYLSGQQSYATESEPYQEEQVHELGTINAFGALLSKRANESTYC